MSRLETIMSIIGGRGSEFYGMLGNKKAKQLSHAFWLESWQEADVWHAFSFACIYAKRHEILQCFLFFCCNLIFFWINSTWQWVHPEQLQFDVSAAFQKVLDLCLFSTKLGERSCLSCGENIRYTFRLESYKRHTIDLQIMVVYF